MFYETHLKIAGHTETHTHTHNSSHPLLSEMFCLFCHYVKSTQIAAVQAGFVG